MSSVDKKKILYIITKSNWGGAQRHVYDLAMNLPKDKFEPVVALGGNGALKEKLDFAGIRTISLTRLERDLSLLKDFPSFLAIYRTIKNEKPDIVHLHSPKAGALGSLASFLYNLRLRTLRLFSPSLVPSGLSRAGSRGYSLVAIYTAHGWPFKEKRKFFWRTSFKIASWLTVLFSDITITVSEDDRKKMSGMPFVSKKLQTIQNGIEKIEFKGKDEARKSLLGDLAEKFKDHAWIGTISELHKNKGLLYSISAVGEIAKEKKEKLIFVVVSGGEERDNLEKIIKEKGLEETVFLVGAINDANSLLTAFDIFILASLKEGMPYVILEAGAASLPVIATDVGGVPEIIKDMQEGILVRPKRVREIKEALTYLLNHPEERKIFGKNLQKKVLSEFSQEKMMSSILEIYGKRL